MPIFGGPGSTRDDGVVDEWMGPLAGLGFWAGIVLLGAIAGRLETRRLSRPPPWRTSYELAHACPRCSQALHGAAISDERIERMRPESAWGKCFSCGYAAELPVRYPWTSGQRETVEGEERELEERQLISTYETELLSLRERQESRRIAHIEGLLQGTPTQFEHSVARILEANGYADAIVVGGGGDLSVDIECLSPNGERTAVQCKRYLDKPVGSKEIQTFIGMLYGHHKVKTGVYVTTSRFTRPAQDLAEEHGIELIDNEKLGEMASVLMPTEEENEAERIAELQDALNGLPTWQVVTQERIEEANRVIRQARLDELEWQRKHPRQGRYYRGY